MLNFIHKAEFWFHSNFQVNWWHFSKKWIYFVQLQVKLQTINNITIEDHFCWKTNITWIWTKSWIFSHLPLFLLFQWQKYVEFLIPSNSMQRKLVNKCQWTFQQLDLDWNYCPYLYLSLSTKQSIKYIHVNSSILQTQTT